jgi:hypothetical protein
LLQRAFFERSYAIEMWRSALAEVSIETGNVMFADQTMQYRMPSSGSFIVVPKTTKILEVCVCRVEVGDDYQSI